MLAICRVSSRTAKWLKCGVLIKSNTVVIHGHKYYLEEVKLSSYNEALAEYNLFLTEVVSYSEIIDLSYDLYDWTICYIQFSNKTLGIKLNRPANKIQLAQRCQSVRLEMIEGVDVFSSKFFSE